MNVKVTIKKICCIMCIKYRTFKNPERSCIFDKTIVPSIICSRCGLKDKDIFKGGESLKSN